MAGVADSPSPQDFSGFQGSWGPKNLFFKFSLRIRFFRKYEGLDGLLCYIYGMAATNFTRKKVESLTLGEKLRKIRNDHRISLAEASKATRIQVKYLEALEDGSYEKLPPEVYVRGFLRGYAGFLGVPEEAILRMYDRERSIQKNLGRGEPFRFEPHSPIRFRIDLSSKAVVVAAISIVSLGFFSYLYLEFRSFVSEPRLVIVEPTDRSTVRTADLMISGETDRRAKVSINDQETIVSEDGLFSDHVMLMPGLNIITVSAVNRFGKERMRTVTVSADIPEQVAAPAISEADMFPMRVTVSIRMTETATVTVETDGGVVFSGELPRDEMRRFEAKSEIRISSGKGTAVSVRTGNDPEQVLSADPGPAERIFRAVADEGNGGNQVSNQ